MGGECVPRSVGMKGKVLTQQATRRVLVEVGGWKLSDLVRWPGRIDKWDLEVRSIAWTA